MIIEKLKFLGSEFEKAGVELTGMKRLAIAACILLGSLALEAGAPLAYAQSSSSTAFKSTGKASAKKKKRRHRREPKQKAPTPDRIMEIQEALARNGCYQGDPTGKWDSSTVAAMQKFQGDHGLDVTGKIDALTLQKLGLGSDIAGAFAPRPVTPPSGSPTPGSAAAPANKPQPPKTGGPSSVTQVTTSAPSATTAPTHAAPAVTPNTPAATTSNPASPRQPQ